MRLWRFTWVPASGQLPSSLTGTTGLSVTATHRSNGTWASLPSGSCVRSRFWWRWPVPVAEMIHSGEPYHPGFVAEWAADWSEAWETAATVRANEKLRLVYLEQATVRLYKTMKRDDYWAALAAIVDNLLAHETLEGDQVEEVMAQWLN